MFLRKKSKARDSARITVIKGTLACVEGSHAKDYRVDLLLGPNKERISVLDVPDGRLDNFPNGEAAYKTYTMGGNRYLIDPELRNVAYKVVPYADRTRTDDE